MESAEQKRLKKRYLIWLYKTTKEMIDRIERKCTQLDIDRFILAELEALDSRQELAEQIAKWDAYIHRKEQDAASLKSQDMDMRKEYLFLEYKLRAIEKAIQQECGKRELEEIRVIYENEMIDRILASTDH